jgi:tripartite-type tricarboxylate transporter receptor subunit TctC
MPGASGAIGYSRVAKSAPDGYTITIASTGTFAVSPSFNPKIGYDPLKDFEAVAMFARLPIVLVSKPSAPFTGVTDLIAYARANPGKLNYASVSPGTTSHILGEMLKLQTKTDIVHVPYKGGGPAVADLLAGQVQMVFESFANLGPHIRAGKLRALLVTSRERSPQYPDVPDIVEAGLPQFEIAFWSGLVAPAGTPVDIVNRLNAEVRRALASPEARATLAAQGLDPMADTPAEFATFIAREVEQWGRAVKASGARAE